MTCNEIYSFNHFQDQIIHLESFKNFVNFITKRTFKVTKLIFITSTKLKVIKINGNSNHAY